MDQPELWWSKVFGPADPDTILNRIDESVEMEDYCDRAEGFMDLVEEALGKSVPSSQIKDIALGLLTWAEGQE